MTHNPTEDVDILITVMKFTGYSATPERRIIRTPRDLVMHGNVIAMVYKEFSLRIERNGTEQGLLGLIAIHPGPEEDNPIVGLISDVSRPLSVAYDMYPTIRYEDILGYNAMVRHDLGNFMDEYKHGNTRSGRACAIEAFDRVFPSLDPALTVLGVPRPAMTRKESATYDIWMAMEVCGAMMNVADRAQHDPELFMERIRQDEKTQATYILEPIISLRLREMLQFYIDADNTTLMPWETRLAVAEAEGDSMPAAPRP